MVEGVSESTAGGELVEVGPEHRGERVPAVVAAGGADREKGEQREPLGLGGQRAELATVRTSESVGARAD